MKRRLGCDATIDSALRGIGRALLGLALALVAVLALAAAGASGAPGDLDTSFGGDGWETIDPGRSDVVRSVAVQPDGKIVLAGYADDGTNGELAVARYPATTIVGVGSFVGSDGPESTRGSSAERRAGREPADQAQQ